MLIGCCGLWLGFRRLLQGVTAGKIHKLFAFFIARSCPNLRGLGQAENIVDCAFKCKRLPRASFRFSNTIVSDVCLSSGLVSRFWAESSTTNKQNGDAR